MTTNLSTNPVEQLMGNVTIEMVTPKMAQEMLANSMTNRNLRMGDVDRYTSDMTRGDWDFNYDPIRFTEDGHLLDGQHRLHALIFSGKTLPFMIVRGLKREQQITMDAGVGRKFHDILKIQGEHSYFDLAALLRQIAIIKDTGSMWHMDGKKYKPSHYRMLHILDEDSSIRTIIHKVYRCRTLGLPKSIAGGCWYQFNKLDPYDCAAFFEKFISGTMLEEDDPIYALRRILASNNTMQANRGAAMWKAALTIKAWNAFRDGEKVAALSWRKGGATPEKFPVPH